jgi:hypothetical protein
MSHIPAPASSFYTDLLQFDLDTTRRLKRHGCQTCGGALDRADYGRKYRGAVAGEVSGFDQRFSLCCRRDGCRRRLTPQSVRFLGRKVYLAFLVVLASAEASEKRLSLLAKESGISRQTLARWLAFWRLKVPVSAPWKSIKAAFMPPLALADLPGALRRVFNCTTLASDAWISLLRCIAPLGKVT